MITDCRCAKLLHQAVSENSLILGYWGRCFCSSLGASSVVDREDGYLEEDFR